MELSDALIKENNNTEMLRKMAMLAVSSFQAFQKNNPSTNQTGFWYEKNK